MKAFYESHRDKNTSIFLKWKEQNTCIAHFHQQIEILYVNEGELNVSINNDTFLLKENQFAFFDSFDIHSYTHDSDVKTTVLTLPYAYISQFINFKRSRKFKKHIIEDEKTCKTILGLIRQLYEDSPNELSLNGIANNILGLASSLLELISVSEPSDLDFAREVLLYIDNNFNQEITLESLSKTFGYSKHYFSKIFKNYTQNNFKEYLNATRLRNAFDLMKQQVKPVDAAFESGFTSLQTFYRCFKEYFGKTPNELLIENK